MGFSEYFLFLNLSNIYLSYIYVCMGEGFVYWVGFFFVFIG